MMVRGPDAESIGVAATHLLASGAVGDPLLRVAARVGVALPVMRPEGPQHSWFVPLTVGERLAAFLQILTDGTLMRFSSFQRRPGDLDSCPLAADWLDAPCICQRAQALRPGRQAGEPVLTFDGNPDRLAWLVRLTNPSGETHEVYVAGSAVYERAPAGGVG